VSASKVSCTCYTYTRFDTDGTIGESYSIFLLVSMCKENLPKKSEKTLIFTSKPTFNKINISFTVVLQKLLVLRNVFINCLFWYFFEWFNCLKYATCHRRWQFNWQLSLYNSRYRSVVEVRRLNAIHTHTHSLNTINICKIIFIVNIACRSHRFFIGSVHSRP